MTRLFERMDRFIRGLEGDANLKGTADETCIHVLRTCLFPKTLVSKGLSGAGLEISLKLPCQRLRLNGYVAL